MSAKEGERVLTERQNSLIKLIVENYIKSAQPIGSKALCDALECSSATIRNEMSVLESLELIEKTHISSGRIPSEHGYRYYVDNLMNTKEMTGEEVLKLQTIFQNNSLQINDAVVESMKIIADMTNYTSIVLGSNADNNLLKQVQFVPLDEKSAVAIVVTDKGHVENRIISIPSNVSQDEVKKAIDVMNELLVETPITDVCDKLEFEIKPIISQYISQHDALINAFIKAFNQFSKNNNVHFAGKSNMIFQPEFNDADKMRRILGVLKEESISDYIHHESDGIDIYIGSENQISEDCTIITTTYDHHGEEGIIAIIGPKRMEYNRVMGLLDFIKKNIDEN